MLKSSLVLITIAFYVSCNTDPKAIAHEATRNYSQLNCQVSIANSNGNESIADSLRDPHHFYYLSDLPTGRVALLILHDSIKASENEVSFRCLDSLSSYDPAARAFYFGVFRKIISNPDGALSEVVGEFSKKYIENYPKEFATYAADFSKPQMELWAFQTVEHVLAAVEQKRLKNADEWASQVVKNCKDCDAPRLNALKQFNSILLRAAKDHNDED